MRLSLFKYSVLSLARGSSVSAITPLPFLAETVLRGPLRTTTAPSLLGAALRDAVASLSCAALRDTIALLSCVTLWEAVVSPLAEELRCQDLLLLKQLRHRRLLWLKQLRYQRILWWKPLRALPAPAASRNLDKGSRLKSTRMVKIRVAKLKRRKSTNCVVMKYYQAKISFAQNNQSRKQIKLPQGTRTGPIARAITKFNIKEYFIDHPQTV